ncbi:hypothetical protein QYE76_058810 [Lolium multiflorum]|uniref:Reverse transcriptase Ty1/copia-type domain-containing protein n=1 Tax=Lolium multiflorum TaxID=4521 RepID=A0AAD8T643_LOLMU|nr:hypothetical protein QYE76_058810 [Lolium multiflorum]
MPRLRRLRLLRRRPRPSRAPVRGFASRVRDTPRTRLHRVDFRAFTSHAIALPASARAALRDPQWLAAMQDEFDALQRNQTWTLVPRPPHANIITGKWVFKHKFHPDGTLDRHKARWVVRGFRQRAGVDFTDTFAPVVKPGTIRTVLQLAVSRAWPVHQMDVSNAFLHGHLEEQVFCQQPTGFVDSAHPDHVCLLSRSLYGLKQAPRAWYQRIAAFLHQLGFRSTRSDASLFVYNNGAATAYLLLYLTERLRAEFALKDLGPLHYFLGIEVVRRTDGFFLHRRKYAHELLDRAGMLNCKSAATPVDTKSKLSATDGSLATDASSYRSIVGALQYLTLTRPELQYAVQQVCLHMHAPRDPHWAAVKRILRYIRGTMDFGLSLHASTATDIVAYSDADWAGCPDTRRSTSGYCVYFGPSLISWSSKRQPTVSRSSAEAEYRAVANAVAEVSWLRQLLVELSCPVAKATVVYCDNVSAVYLSANPVHHRRTKHIELDIHFVREQVALLSLVGPSTFFLKISSSKPRLLTARRRVRRPRLAYAAAPLRALLSPAVADGAAPAARPPPSPAAPLEGELDGATNMRLFEGTGVVLELLLRLEGLDEGALRSAVSSGCGAPSSDQSNSSLSSSSTSVSSARPPPPPPLAPPPPICWRLSIIAARASAAANCSAPIARAPPPAADAPRVFRCCARSTHAAGARSSHAVHEPRPLIAPAPALLAHRCSTSSRYRRRRASCPVEASNAPTSVAAACLLLPPRPPAAEAGGGNALDPPPAAPHAARGPPLECLLECRTPLPAPQWRRRRWKWPSPGGSPLPPGDGGRLWSDEGCVCCRRGVVATIDERETFYRPRREESGNEKRREVRGNGRWRANAGDAWRLRSTRDVSPALRRH